MPSVAMASAPGVYDAAPWSENDSLTSSFRRWLENYHNQVHNLVRGDMISGTSPNDPIFWLHHCNVDRIWAAWQALHPQAIYLPKSGAPLGHNLNDPMLYLLTPNVTPEMVLDPDQYDTLVP
jgi:tyrosinase